jgi:murein DD-endopeptidase MepM/ murein hydrolase activator NlpD
MLSDKKKIISALFLVFIFPIVLLSYASLLHAQSTSDLQSKIDQHNTDIANLQKEIDQYNAQVTAVGAQAKTLQNNIKTLDLTSKKLTANLSLTQDKIDTASLFIQQLSTTIATTSTQISLNQKSIAEMIREMYQTEGQSAVENFFAYKTFSELWDGLEKNHELASSMQAKSNELVSLKSDLTDKKTTQETQKQQLTQLQQDLNDQKKIVAENTAEKATLLAQTKDQEASYKKILADKQAQQAQYEKELFDYESQLQLITSPDQIPGAHHGMISWPVDNVYITQLFGVTNASARLYVSGSHNGVDFRASIGTPVKAVLGGTVVGTGNTDLEAGCYSFGRWIMIKHNNGLSTIYGHLSLIKVSIGQTVSTGDVIGLSGYSGYVYPPGPAGAHLHLGVYATAGVEIKQFIQSRGCKQVIVPIADTKAYLDPMLYLPIYNQ